MKTQITLEREEIEILLECINDRAIQLFEFASPSDIAFQIKFGQLRGLHQVISQAKSSFENTPDANNIGFSEN